MRRINAIAATTPNGVFRSCPDCFCSNHNVSIEQLKELDGQSLDGVVSFEVIEENSKEDDTLFGRLCLDCRAPLAGWAECAICGKLYWIDMGHDCDPSAYPQLWQDVMEGLDDGNVEDFSSYDQDPIDM